MEFFVEARFQRGYDFVYIIFSNQLDMILWWKIGFMHHLRFFYTLFRVYFDAGCYLYIGNQVGHLILQEIGRTPLHLN